MFKTKWRVVPGWLATAILCLTAFQAWSQESAGNATIDAPQPNTKAGSGPTQKMPLQTYHYVPSEDSSRPGLSGAFVDLLEDQKRIWTSPAHIRLSDANWLVPLGGVTAGLFVTDSQYSASINQSPTTISHYKSVSDYGVAGLIGGAAGLYAFSFPAHNDHWRETGFLSGEAALNSLITVEALKYSLGRARPYQDNGSGAFFHGGTSFPSEHAAAAWSIAGIFAHEYPGPVPSVLAYGAASLVSFSRIKAHQHFPSDVLVGSVLGYLISQNIYRHRHNAEIAGSAWESPHEFFSEDADRERTPAFMGSPYVPLDSWVYPAMERLAALGYLKSPSLSIRPWTRLECARLLGEAGELLPETSAPTEAQQLYSALTQEFARDAELMSGETNRSAQLESVYVRALGIAGKPLTDNFHFGQTLLNDYGRPYQEGFNSVAGVSGYTTMGPFVVYTRGEFQSAPSAPSLSQGALNFISAADNLPPNPPQMPIASISHFQLLDAYVGMNVANWQFSFGRRSLWWGPSDGATLAFTNNALPLNKMFSIDRVSPFRLPWVLRYLGDIRLSAFIGQLSGQEFVTNGTGGTQGTIIGQYGVALRPQPFLSGEKISFKFTQNFEFSMSKTTIYGGPGNPLTFKTYLQSTLGQHSHGDPVGDGRTFADFSYRIPKLRDWITFYGETFSEDEATPIIFMHKSTYQGGLYFAKVPKIHRLDLRLEGGSTVPYGGYFCISCFYFNGEYLNGYNNDNRLIGTWIGRAAQGELIRTNYWLSPKRRIGLELRHRIVNQQFLPQGGSQNDVAVNADLFAGSGLRVTTNLQYERWQIPMLAPNRQSDWSASFQLGYWPAHAH